MIHAQLFHANAKPPDYLPAMGGEKKKQKKNITSILLSNRICPLNCYLIARLRMPDCIVDVGAPPGILLVALSILLAVPPPALYFVGCHGDGPLVTGCVPTHLTHGVKEREWKKKKKKRMRKPAYLLLDVTEYTRM